MAANWVTIFNRLFEIINLSGECYFSGSRFIGKVREIDPDFPDYQQYIAERNRTGKSTSRKSYFYDILLGFDEYARMRLLHSILADVEVCGGEKVKELRAFLGGKALAPTIVVPMHAWNAERLNDYLNEVDACIAAGGFDRSVTLAYTCLEGFYKAFARKNLAQGSPSDEIIALSRAIKKHLGDSLPAYPDEALNMINHISNLVDRARNKFSESHFEGSAASWLAVYVRDLVNTQIRLLLHFM